MYLNENNKKKALVCAEKIANWLCFVQYPYSDRDPRSGTYPASIYPDGKETLANNWNLAFAIMGLLSAYKTFKDPKYETAALRMGDYLRSLQIFDPFNKKHYGAIREVTPQTPWCYTRDALSAAWGFLELYEYTGNEEYLERAVLWAEWFMKNGLDEDGWPLWGIMFGKCELYVQMRNDIQGNFQGGSLNFFYKLAQITGNKKWTGDFFVKMADFFIEYIQQPSGFFVSIERITKTLPQEDPQNGLHRANDDLGTLGLLCAYKATGDERYLRAIEKFLKAVFSMQDENGYFEDSVASIPIVLNILHEADSLIDTSFVTTENKIRALEALYARQSDGKSNPRCAGGFIERTKDKTVRARSSCYALILLLKIVQNRVHS